MKNHTGSTLPDAADPGITTVSCAPEDGSVAPATVAVSETPDHADMPAVIDMLHSLWGDEISLDDRAEPLPQQDAPALMAEQDMTPCGVEALGMVLKSYRY